MSVLKCTSTIWVEEAIARVKGISHVTVLNWVKQVGELLPDAYNPETIPQVGELDELEMRNALARKHLNSIQANGEGENTRHYLARLRRKTLCYSKSETMLGHSVRLLIHYLKFKDVPVPYIKKYALV